jgi:hypothetical protein
MVTILFSILLSAFATTGIAVKILFKKMEFFQVPIVVIIFG